MEEESSNGRELAVGKASNGDDCASKWPKLPVRKCGESAALEGG